MSIPSELIDKLMPDSSDGILAKERPGCLSFWSARGWQEKLDAGAELTQRKM